MNNIELIQSTGNYLYKGSEQAYKRGMKANPRAVKKFDIELNFRADAGMLQNFMVESFTVAGVLNAKLRDKLKDLAKKIIEGKTAEQVIKGVEGADAKEVFIKRAKELLQQYQYVQDVPVPDGYLKTNFRTALTSAYGAGLWNNITQAGIYRYLQYKTREDGKVRPEHQVLENSIFLKEDEIWNEIYPPNSWNCRCYVIPLTMSEAKGKDIIKPDRTKEEREKLTGSVDVNFRRNAAKMESIWGKWVDDNFNTNKDVVKLMHDTFKESAKYFKKFSDEKIIKFLDENAMKERKIEATQENWDKDFPNGTVKTPMGAAKFKDKVKIKINGDEKWVSQYEKLTEKDDGKRQQYIGLIKPTLEEPLLVLQDDQKGLLFIKSFKQSDKLVGFLSATYQNGDLNVWFEKGNIKLDVVSNYNAMEGIKRFFNKIRTGDILHLKASATTNPGKFTRNISPSVPAVFNLKTNLDEKFSNVNNEIWGEVLPLEFGKRGSIMRIISYGIDGIRVREAKYYDGKTTRDEMAVGYEKIDEYRRGVNIQLRIKN